LSGHCVNWLFPLQGKIAVDLNRENSSSLAVGGSEARFVTPFLATQIVRQPHRKQQLLGNLRCGDCRRRLIRVCALHIARIHGSHDIVVSLAGLDPGILVLSRHNQRGIKQHVRPSRRRSPVHVVAHDGRRACNPIQSHRIRDWLLGRLDVNA